MIFRAPHEKDFTVMSNKFLQDIDLSFEAKGIMAYMLTLPNDHNIDLDEIITHGKTNKNKFQKAMKELRDKGYFKRFFLKSNKKSLFCGSRNDLHETQTILLLADGTQTILKVKPKILVNPEKKRQGPSDAGWRLAQQFYEKVECNIKIKPNMRKWASEFDKIMLLDGHKEPRISELIDYFQQDEWFKYHILSPGTFVIFWDRIWNKFQYDQVRREKKEKFTAGEQAIQQLLEEEK